MTNKEECNSVKFYDSKCCMVSSCYFNFDIHFINQNSVVPENEENHLKNAQSATLKITLLSKCQEKHS